MKYIKEYESSNQNIKYWKLPTQEPQLTIALEKIKKEHGCDITRFDIYHIYSSGLKPKFGKELYMIYKEFYSEKTKQNEVFWYWDSPKLLSKRKYKNYKDMGEIEITDEDIERFNISNTANKYNV